MAHSDEAADKGRHGLDAWQAETDVVVSQTSFITLDDILWKHTSSTMGNSQMVPMLVHRQGRV